MTQWISVKERLPELDGPYLVYWWATNDRVHNYRVADWFASDWYINNTGPYRNLCTHWLPLPPPPEVP